MQTLTQLHKAAQRGDEQQTKELLDEGADPGAKDSEARTPLHHAVMRGHLAVVQLLMDRGPPDLLLSKDILGCTPVHLAAVQNQVTLILMLVSALLRDKAGTTPLHEIARRKCLQDFMGFLHLGWDIAAKEESPGDAEGELTPEWVAAAGELDLKRPGLTAVRTTMGWSPLHMAAMEGRVGLIRSLVKDHGCSLTQRAANSWTPLHYAAAHNQVEAIEELVRLGCSAAVKDSVNSTPMHVAAGEGHLEAILLLVQLGCAAAVKDRDGCTPLYCAAAWNQVEAVRQLDKLGCPSWVRSQEGRTPVHVAAEQGWVDLIDLLVKELKNKVDSRDTYQFTPLHSAANGGHVKTIQKLLHFSHDVDVKDYLGRTPLHYAAMHGRVAAVEELVRQGASTKEKDIRGGYTPLHLAADAGQCEAISALAALGAPMEARSSKGWTPLALATFKGPANVDAIGTLIELGSKVSAVLENSTLETPLHIAARCGRLDIIEKLLRCSVPVDVRARDGSYPLHYAAAFGQSHVVEALVKAGCPVDCKDDAQNTPLHLAAGCGFYDTVEKLVEMGADMSARDIMACTPLQNAAHGTYSALAAMPTVGSAPANGRPQGQQRNAVAGLPSTPGGGSQSHQQALTPAQTATQLALSTGSAARNGKVPVRTGLAWASLGLAGTGADWTSSLWGATATGTEAEASSHAGMGLMQLLKRATRRRNGTYPTAATSTDCTLGLSLKGETERAADGGLEALLRRSEALRAGGLEQDRSRLLNVASRIVELGAEVDARDAEGRTALHLAAGCGDTAMVLQLVQLGSDVNCRDSVGGTPMHHAAMANKKDMMFELARLGCDWRARADGIDGATAAFVLCGQHGKTTRQQKLVEAKLKRVHQEGLAARSQGQHIASLQGITDFCEEEENAGALADANMAALLEQVQLEDQGSKLVMAKRKRKKKKPTKGRASFSDGRTSEDGLADDISQDPATPTGEEAAHTAAMRSEEAAAAGLEENTSVKTDDGDDASCGAPGAEAQTGLGDNRNPGGALPAATGEEESGPPAPEDSNGSSHVPLQDAVTLLQEAARKGLDAATAEAVSLMDSQRQEANAQQEAALLAAADYLDAAIAAAVDACVSAKYGKKVRKRLQGTMDVLQGNLPPQKPCTPQPTASPRKLPDAEVWMDSHSAGVGKGPEDAHGKTVENGSAKGLRHGTANGNTAADVTRSDANGHPRATARQNGVAVRVKSPRTPVSRLPERPHAAQDMHALELGQEVQKPVAQAGMSRTPKRVISAAKDPPAGQLHAPPRAAQQPRSRVQPAVAVKVTSPGLSKQPAAQQPRPLSRQTKPIERAQFQQQQPENPSTFYQPPAARHAPAPQQAQQGGYARQVSQPGSQPPSSWGPVPTNQWQQSLADLPTVYSESRLSHSDAAQQQARQFLLANTEPQHEALQGNLSAAGLQQPSLSMPYASHALAHSMLEHFGLPAAPQSAASGQADMQGPIQQAQDLRYSDLSANAPQWVPSGSRGQIAGFSAQSLGLPTHTPRAEHAPQGSMPLPPGPHIPQGWQGQGLQQAALSLGAGSVGTSSGLGNDSFTHTPDIGSNAFSAFPARTMQEQSSLYTWSAAPTLIPQGSGSMQIWQGQRLPDTRASTWAALGSADRQKHLSRPSADACHGRDPPDIAAYTDSSIGSELAASVLTSEDRRLSLGAFGHGSSIPVARPGYGQLW